MKIGHITPSETGLHYHGKWYRKGFFIEWETIEKMNEEKGTLRIWHKDKNGKIKIKPIGSADKYSKLYDLWRHFLISEVKKNGEVHGTIIIRPDSMFILKVFKSIFFLLLAGFFLQFYSGIYAVFPADFLDLKLWFGYVIYLPWLSMVFIIIYSNLLTFGQRKYKSWKIDKSGFYLESEYLTYKKIKWQTSDLITEKEIRIGGNNLPIYFMTKNVVLPHLLAMSAKKEGISPTFSTHYTKEGLRLFFLWPIALTILWYWPLLLLNIPTDFDASLKATFTVIVVGCWGLGCLLITLSYFIKHKSINNLPKFKALIEEFELNLHW